ncbi:MAG: hypothetical protein IPM90_13765 [Austwickia sp.]|nr:hypothetical protein [Austwickia sp.]
MSVVEQGRGDRRWQPDLEAHDGIGAEVAGIATTPGSSAAQPYLRSLLDSHHPSPADLLKFCRLWRSFSCASPDALGRWSACGCW